MDINNIPKKYFLGAIGVLIVILLVVTLLQPGTYRYTANSPTAADLAKGAAIQKQYADFLASIKPDPDASKQLFKDVINQDQVQQQVADALQVNQKITVPDIADSKLNIIADSGQAPVEQYFKTVQTVANQFADTAGPAAPNLFGDADAGQTAIDTSTALQQLYKTPVPKEAVAYHKAEIGTIEQFLALVQTSRTLDSTQTDPWPQVYKQYAVINTQSSVIKTEFDRLNKQYGLTNPKTNSGLAEKDQNGFFVKTAYAFPVEIISNPDDTIKNILKEAVAAAFAKFMNIFLDKLITDIQNNYYVANFLFYTDALVRGQYVNDYLNKYISNPIDRGIITKFIPQFNCANNKADLGPIFVAKARQYLGFDPSTIDPNSSDFYTKMARLPDLSPEQQALDFQGAAQAAMVQANQAAIIEQLTPTGTKLPRSDVLGKQITTTVASINASLQAAFNAKLGLGTQNSQSVVSQIVSAAITEFTNKYIFKGVVLKEQNTCIQVPQLNPIIPSATISTPPTV